MIEILNSSNEFEYYNNEIIIGRGICDTLIKMPQISEWKQLIKFNINGDDCVIDLFGRSEGTIVVPIDWECFSNEEVKELANKFHLGIKESEILREEGKENYFRLVASKDNLEYYLKLAIKKINLDNIFFLIFFNYDDGESRRSPVLYINRISKVAVSGKLFDKLSALKYS